jgi:predicted Zn-dependent peptidase
MDFSHSEDTIRQARLPNGVLVFTEEMPSVESVAVFGLAHFLEHMIFKGTGKRTAYQLAEEMENVGGQINAYTERELTHVFARALAEHLPVSVDLLGDMICHSAFPPDEMERERQVIVEEVRKYEALPEERIHDLIMDCLWQGGGLGHSILGGVDSVRGLTGGDLSSCWRRHFSTDRTIITGVGKLRHEEFVELAAAAFTDLPAPAVLRPGQPEGRRVPRVIIEEDEEQVNFCWGGYSYPAGDDRNFSLAILDAIFGASATSRLFQEIREKRGLAYDISTEAIGFRETGVFYTTGAANPDNFPEVMALMRGEVERLRREGITDRELKRAKEQMKSGLAMSLESTLERMRRLATHYFTWGEIYPMRYLIQRLDRVTRDEVMQTITEVLDPDRWSFAAIGPVAEEDAEAFLSAAG